MPREISGSITCVQVDSGTASSWPSRVVTREIAIGLQ